MHDQSKLRVAVVGCGMIYAEHMQAFRELADTVEVVAAVDRERRCLDMMRDRWGDAGSKAVFRLENHARRGQAGRGGRLPAEL